ncbi:MAG: cell division protein ZapE [Candidatus Azotimanducaceae bacterium]|jgi:cell division protein ZapE
MRGSRSAPLTTHKGPRDHYELAIVQGEIHADDAQADAVAHLQRLFEALVASQSVPATSPKGVLRSLFGRGAREAAPIRGLYFWGGVGRGKTYLMDLFFDTLPFPNKQRMHFHRFMRHVHQQLQALQGEPNPLRRIAEDFARQYRVLCFDEFFVSDITDAMILAGLLEALFAHGVVLVATSNVAPVNLYRDGLQRSKFLPAIALLEAKTKVLNVDGGVDYRLRVLQDAEIFHSPLDAAADESLARSFKSLSPDAGRPDVVLEIEGRDMITRYCGDGVVWFEFSALCEGPRSQNDYIELAMQFQTVLVSNVPQFTSLREDAARRFISLVDEFYDHNVKLILSAATPILVLYQGERLVFEFQRTESRLQEMQSQEYLAREHQP